MGRRGFGHLVGRLRIRRSERQAIGVVDRFISTAVTGLGLDARSSPWTTRIIVSSTRDFRLMECQMTVHRHDPDFLLATHVRGRVRGAIPVDGRLPRPMEDRIVEKLRRLRRCLSWQDELVRLRLDPDQPPASAYRTDLLTRRLLDAWGIDGSVFVADAPRPVRSRRFVVRSSAAETWIADDGSSLLPEPSPALDPMFPAMISDFDAGFLHTKSIGLTQGVQVRPLGVSGGATARVDRSLPDTILAAAFDIPLNAVVAHGAFDDPAILVRSATRTPTGIVFDVANPVVPLAGPY